MRKMLERKIKTSTAVVYRITTENNTPKIEKMDDITLLGKPADLIFIRKAKTLYGDGTYTIGSITTEETMYEMAVEDFITLATKKAKPETNTNS